jgi:hypothetical protein
VARRARGEKRMNILPCIVAVALGVAFYIVSRIKKGHVVYYDLARTFFVVGLFWLLYVLATHPHGWAMGMSFSGVLQ